MTDQVHNPFIGEHLSLKEKIGQLFFPAAFIHDDDEGIAEIERLISEFKIGGLTFFYSRQVVETNFDQRTQLRQYERSLEKLYEMVAHYQRLSDIPLLISIDAEWGLGMRIQSHPSFPYPLTLGAIKDKMLVYEAGKAIAQELKSVGVHFNLAPVLDINNNPKNPVIGYRSFGDHAERVFQYGLAYYEGMKSVGVLGCAKHFPGHGDTAIDSHLGLPVIDKPKAELIENELYPFIKFIEHKVDCVMTGHLVVPALSKRLEPASLSQEIVTDFLRGELAFKGAITTDALNMKSVAGQMEEGELELKALLAGNNMLSFSQHIAQATQKIAEHAPADVIETSCAQVASLKEKAGLDMKSSMYPTTLKVPSSISLRSQLAAECLTLVKGPSQGVLSGSSDDLLAVLSVLKEMNKSRFAPAKPCPCMELMDISAVTYLKHALQDYHKVVIALHVPSQKPGDQFGLPKDLIAFVNELANAKEVYLYFFGNPYALKYFDQSAIKQIVLAYQNLPEFEMEASNHLNGLSATKGHLPVSSVNILG